MDADPEISPRTLMAAAAYARALPGMHTFYRSSGSDRGYNIVGGAANNVIGPGVVGATIGGGGGVFGSPVPNNVLGDFGTIGGGRVNTASGPRATVPGGHGNSARGRTSFATGYKSKANHDGTFVWNDRSITIFNDSLLSTGTNQFLIRAAVGVGIGTAAPDRDLTVLDGDDSGGTVINLKASNAQDREMLIAVNQSTGGIISMQANNHLDFRTNGNSRL